MNKLLFTFLLSLILFKTGISQWTEIASFEGCKFWDICFINSSTGLITGGTLDNPVILKTCNGGVSWDTVGQKVTGFIFSINFIDDSTGFITSSRNLDSWIFKSTDQGNSWTNVCNLTLHTYNTSFPTDSIGYVIQTMTEYALITKTVDKGNTWEVINSFTTEWGGRGVTDFQFITEDIGYMVYESGIVYKTIDGGLNFEEVYLDYQYDLKSIYFLNTDTGYIVGEEKDYNPFDTSGVVIKTTNGGTDWTIINQVFGDCNDVVFINPDTGFIASEDFMIHSINSGLNWEITNGIYMYYMWSLDFPDLTVGYAVGNIQVGYNFYSGVYRYDLIVGLNNSLEITDNVNIFPNPTTNTLRITNINNVSPENISIYNQNGIRITNFKTENNTVKLPDLISGLYIIEIEYSNWTVRKKIIIK